MNLVWSKYQENIFEAVKYSKDNYVIEAVAGGAKSTTLEESSKYLPSFSTNVFLAFNVTIVEELKKRLPSSVDKATFHKLGLKNLYSFHSTGLTVDNSKILNIYKDLNGKYGSFGDVARLVSLGKSEGVENPDFWDLVEKYSLLIEADHLYYVVPMAEQVFKTSLEMDTIIDFDDMILYNALDDRSNIKQYSNVMVDESQDLNAAQIKFLLKIPKDNGRIICVGDRAQSLYRFRGADSYAMDKVKHAIQAKELPLSVCYRCGKNIISLAKELVPQIEPWENSPEGLVTYDKELEFLYKYVKGGDMILCRTNAPLISACFKLISHGISAKVRGRDIGKDLVSLVKKIIDKFPVISTIEDFLKYLAIYEKDQVYKLIAMEKHSAAGNLQDRTQSLGIIASQVDNISQIEFKIKSLFSDDIVPVLFSSVHKAKGLEANRVFIIRPDLMPHPMAKSEEDKQQEMNIKYVAITRAKKELHFVGGK